METEYFMRYFSSAICYDMNIIRWAAVPFQPTRKAFSTNSECSSVWNSQKMKNGGCKRHHGYQLEKTLPKLQCNFLVTDGDTWRLTDPRKGCHQEGRVKFLTAPVSSPQTSSDHCTKIPSDSVREGSCGDNRSFCGWQWWTLMAFEGRGDRQGKFRSETSLKQENTMKRIAKQNEKPSQFTNISISAWEAKELAADVGMCVQWLTKIQAYWQTLHRKNHVEIALRYDWALFLL